MGDVCAFKVNNFFIYFVNKEPIAASCISGIQIKRPIGRFVLSLSRAFAISYIFARAAAIQKISGRFPSIHL